MYLGVCIYAFSLELCPRGQHKSHVWPPKSFPELKHIQPHLHEDLPCAMTDEMFSRAPQDAPAAAKAWPAAAMALLLLKACSARCRGRWWATDSGYGHVRIRTRSALCLRVRARREGKHLTQARGRRWSQRRRPRQELRK